MISLQAPFWLLLLGVIPLIRWLHRFSQQSRTFPSTTLFLWRQFPQHQNTDVAAARQDPRWLLRALIIALLALSLTAPAVRTGQGPSLDVWVDDSLSMFTREQLRTRLQLAMEQLRNYLIEIKPSRIQLHSLGNPASRLTLDPADVSGWQARLAEWTSLPRGEPSPPAVASLSHDRDHVLISDGADNTLNDWALTAPLQHIIRVGHANRNIALSRLALRESLNGSVRINGIARIDNLADIPQTVRLILQLEQQVIETRTLDIPAYANTITAFTIPTGERGELQARIASANDPLPLDDSLQLTLDKLFHPIRYAMPVPCGLRISAVLDSTPALVQDNNQPDVIIDCSGKSREFAQPVLRFHPVDSVRRTAQPAHWHHGVAMDSLQLTAGIPYSEEAPALTADATPILSADGRLLILQQQDTGNAIDIYIDTRDPVFAGRPEYPLLILGLIRQVTGQSLEFTPLTTARDVDASRIVPVTLSTVPASPAKAQPMQSTLVPLLLFATLLSLALDAAIAGGLLRRFGKLRG